MMYVVLGMHKSGTTLVAEILHRSGIRMVEESVTDLDYDAGNKYERFATQRLNKDLLNCHNVESYDIALPCLLDVSAARRREMDEIVLAASSAGTDWGFKDPRSCLTYRAWLPSLSAHRLIVVYRHPSSVWKHYRDQAGWLTSLRALQSWSLHNRLLLDILPGASVPVLVLNYERLMDGQIEFERLSSFVGKPLVDARKSSMNRKKPGGGMSLAVIDKVAGLLGDVSPLGVFKELETARDLQAGTKVSCSCSAAARY